MKYRIQITQHVSVLVARLCSAWKGQYGFEPVTGKINWMRRTQLPSCGSGTGRFRDCLDFIVRDRRVRWYHPIGAISPASSNHGLCQTRARRNRFPTAISYQVTLCTVYPCASMRRQLLADSKTSRRIPESGARVPILTRLSDWRRALPCTLPAACQSPELPLCRRWRPS
jgi:hypothetical protein